MQQTIVVFANDKITGDAIELSSEAAALKEAGIRIVVMDLGAKLDRKQSDAIASNNAFFFAPLLDELDYYVFPVYQATLPGRCYLG